ncbi:MAG TPA: hypothetical protein VF283_18075 [Bryobacteraceae bacterium]
MTETETEHARILAALRESFEPAALRLTPETEPAIIYTPAPKEQNL